MKIAAESAVNIGLDCNFGELQEKSTSSQEDLHPMSKLENIIDIA